MLWTWSRRRRPFGNSTKDYDVVEFGSMPKGREKERERDSRRVLAKKRETATRDLYRPSYNVSTILENRTSPITLTMNSLSRLHVHVVTMDRLVGEINGNFVEVLAISDYSIV